MLRIGSEREAWVKLVVVVVLVVLVETVGIGGIANITLMPFLLVVGGAERRVRWLLLLFLCGVLVDVLSENIPLHTPSLLACALVVPVLLGRVKSLQRGGMALVGLWRVHWVVALVVLFFLCMVYMLVINFFSVMSVEWVGRVVEYGVVGGVRSFLACVLFYMLLKPWMVPPESSI